MNIARTDWARALGALPAEEIRAAAAQFTRSLEVQDISLPQAGLGLLTLTDSAFHQPFYLGEVLVARAHVVLRTADGAEASGGAVILDDSKQLVRAMAILDAVLAARLPGWESAATLLQRGHAVQAEMAAQRQHLLARTRVDFSILGLADEEEEEDDE